MDSRKTNHAATPTCCRHPAPPELQLLLAQCGGTTFGTTATAEKTTGPPTIAETTTTTTDDPANRTGGHAKCKLAGHEWRQQGAAAQTTIPIQQCRGENRGYQSNKEKRKQEKSPK